MLTRKLPAEWNQWLLQGKNLTIQRNVFMKQRILSGAVLVAFFAAIIVFKVYRQYTKNCISFPPQNEMQFFGILSVHLDAVYRDDPLPS